MNLVNECKFFFERKSDKSKEELIALIDAHKNELKPDFSYWAALVPLRGALEEGDWDYEANPRINLEYFSEYLSRFSELLNAAVFEIGGEEYSGDIWDMTQGLLYLFLRSCKIDFDNQVSLAAWLTRCLGFHELAIEICDLQLMLDPELGSARYVRCRANLAKGDITDFESEMAIAMKTGADIATCKRLIAWYEIQTGQRSSADYPDEEIYTNKNLVNQIIESRRLLEFRKSHSEDRRLELQKELKSLGLEYMKNPTTEILLAENKLISQLVRWPNDMISIWGSMPLFVNEDELSATTAFKEFTAPFNLILSREDLLFYRGTIRSIMAYPTPDMAKFFDINPIVWLKQLEDQKNYRVHKTYTGSQYLHSRASKNDKSYQSKSSRIKPHDPTMGMNFFDGLDI